MEQQPQNTRLRNAGFLTFFFSGICAISSGVVVSLLQEKYGFAYGMTGTLLSLMSIGNLLAGFLTGVLPGVLGFKPSVLLLTTGYALGYGMMGLSGAELLEQLRNGIWQDTDHLPPELELANRLNVSRTVVRDALSELERAGYIERVRGIGTVINRDVVNLARRMDQKFEFTQMIRARGMQPNSDDLRVSRHTADADAAQALNISLDTPVYYICRRVLADNTPVLFSTDIVPCSLFGTTRTDGIDFTRPIFNILDEACGIQVSSTITHLRAAMGDSAVRHALALQRDQALLELSETCYSRLCRPVLRCRTFYTDFFDFALVRKLV